MTIRTGAAKFWDRLLVWLPFYWLLQADTLKWIIPHEMPYFYSQIRTIAN